MLHLLREESVTRAVDAFPDTSKIYERNIRTLRGLSAERLRTLLDRAKATTLGNIPDISEQRARALVEAVAANRSVR